MTLPPRPRWPGARRSTPRSPPTRRAPWRRSTSGTDRRRSCASARPRSSSWWGRGRTGWCSPRAPTRPAPVRCGGAFCPSTTVPCSPSTAGSHAGRRRLLHPVWDPGRAGASLPVIVENLREWTATGRARRPIPGDGAPHAGERDEGADGAPAAGRGGAVLLRLAPGGRGDDPRRAGSDRVPGTRQWRGQRARRHGVIFHASSTPEDHPRVRGEQHPVKDLVSGEGGPSPRARGADKLLENFGARNRTIPACAGSSLLAGLLGDRRGDHPRVRGEQGKTHLLVVLTLGPSPRARGAGPDLQVAGRDPGTVPACAGSRLVQSDQLGLRGDHPRVRGEQTTSTWRTGPRWGPSPRARGAGRGGRRRRRGSGTIPACAGSSPGPRFRSSTGGDHPRVRGEQRNPMSSTFADAGPSPRARGAGTGREACSGDPGTIPACAGSRVTKRPGGVR
jgi:hypothetical protein